MILLMLVIMKILSLKGNFFRILYMDLKPFLNEFFKTPESQESCKILREYGAQCNSFIEFGTRGGVTAIVLLQALIDSKQQFSPRFVGVDLIHDESIVKLHEISEKIGVSFQFWQGHSKDFPLHETDGFLWDTFHCAGNLLFDLTRIEQYTHKYIIVVGTEIDRIKSEAIRRSLNIEMVAKELRISPSDAEKGLSFAISEFLEKNPSWIKVYDKGDITILKRVKDFPKWLFKD